MGLCRPLCEMLCGADIVALTHTGQRPGAAPPGLDGLECIVCSPRAHQATWGGVALYARRGLHTTLLQDLPEWGQAWVRVGGKGGLGALHVCVCYLPPVGSSYFREEDGALSSELHYQKLKEMLAKYASAGDVLVMGDLNARTGGGDDRVCDITWREWQALDEAGVAAPADMLPQAAHALRVPRRASADTGRTNAHGAFVVELCKDAGLVILNGRLPGDPHGACTFHQHGDTERGRSLIDYCLANPGLVFLPSGQAKDGAELHVWDAHDRLVGACGFAFDHLPVSLSVPFDAAPHPAKCHPTGERTRICRWLPHHRDLYCGVLVGDREVVDSLSAMRECADVDHANHLFGQAVRLAVDKLVEMGVRAVRGARTHVRGQPCNPWFGVECKAARRAVAHAIRASGAGSPEARLAFREYKRMTQAARRAWERERDAQLVRDACGDPKTFWRAYNAKPRKDGGIALEEWSQYFAELFGEHQAVVAHPPSPPDSDSDLRECVFGVACEAQCEAANVLNNDISVAEVAHALRMAANGKSPGVDGLPLEYLKHATQEVDVGGKTVQVNLLAGHITHLFNKVMYHGYPKAWSLGAVAPVPKAKGDPGNKDDYRGIVVGSALPKLFSMVMLHRLDKWAEDNLLRELVRLVFARREARPTMLLCSIMSSRSITARSSPCLLRSLTFAKHMTACPAICSGSVCGVWVCTVVS